MRDLTYIALLLDRSGSMGSIKNDVIGGFNNFVADQKKAGDNALLTLTQFDSYGIDVVHESKPIKDVIDLNDETYQPRGGTPLLDALAKTIQSTGAALKAIPETERPDKVVFVIITDGQENSSHQFNKSQVREMIEHQENVYKWNFVYLGANQDAFAEAGAVGILQTNAANFTPNNMAKGYAAASANVARYRGSGLKSDLKWSAEQRQSMTDDQTDSWSSTTTSTAAK